MRLVSYIEIPVISDNPSIKLGALVGEDCVVDLEVAQTWAQGARGFHARELPSDTMRLLRNWADEAPHIQTLLDLLQSEDCLTLRGTGRRPVSRTLETIALLSPVPYPGSLRDFYSFEQHVKTVFELRGREVPSEWYEQPAFYYANPYTIMMPEQGVSPPCTCQALDYELEIACVIGRAGRNITPEEASEYIAGYMIMNDWSARDIQRKEMRVGLGPAKGKDFATSLGPALVTPDELADRQVGNGADLRYDLIMTARVNDTERSRGNFKDIYWTFPQMIAHASQDVTLFPGEVIGSGTVGMGCLLEQGAEESGQWLRPGDVVELSIERLGVLRNRVTVPE
jgi:2-keto-4-pentenoate hydratase/2-oxohepta-3-ene-1,7-dioic acid hydratase in catechol pathway